MIITNLVKELKDLKSKYLVITGDGRNEFNIMQALCQKFNGLNKVLWFPSTPQKRQSGLGALNAIKWYYNYGITSIIFIVDGEYINEDAINEVQKQLLSFGVKISEVSRIHEAFSIRCRSGNNNLILYCIISGTETCIEEEIARLIDLEYNIKIDISGNRDRCWIDRIKGEIKQILKERNKSLQNFIRDTGKTKVENAFPNICAVLRKIEENFQF